MAEQQIIAIRNGHEQQHLALKERMEAAETALTTAEQAGANLTQQLQDLQRDITVKLEVAALESKAREEEIRATATQDAERAVAEASASKQAAFEATIDTIVRQREAWMRAAVTDFAKGRAEEGLRAFETRGLFTLTTGEKPTVTRIVDAWENTQRVVSNPSVLLIAKTNAQVRALNDEVRVRFRRDGRIVGDDIAVAAVTPSGHGQPLAFATGDRIRFLVRHDQLSVINGTTATITHIDDRETQDATLHVEIAGRLAQFRVSDLADEHGRARLGHAYSTTIYGAQGLTTDQAFIWASPSMTRHDAYVAFSRARARSPRDLCRHPRDRRASPPGPAAVGTAAGYDYAGVAARLVGGPVVAAAGQVLHAGSRPRPCRTGARARARS